MDLKTYALRRVGNLTDEQEIIEDPTGGYYLKDEVDLKLKAYNEIIKKLQYYTSDVRENMEYRVKGSTRYLELFNIPDNKLPLFINNWCVDSPEHFIISCRLSKEDPFKKNLNKCIELLYDVEFNMEEYKNIGYNDGLATLTSILLDIAGYGEEARQAIDATYSLE